jgi:hypothetical protein
MKGRETNACDQEDAKTPQFDYSQKRRIAC